MKCVVMLNIIRALAYLKHSIYSKKLASTVYLYNIEFHIINWILEYHISKLIPVSTHINV